MSRMSEEARRQREEEVEITIGQVGKARAAEVIAALRVHNRSPEEVGQIIMATAMYLVGVLLASLNTEQEVKEQMKLLVEDRMPEVIADLKQEIRKEQETRKETEGDTHEKSQSE